VFYLFGQEDFTLKYFWQNDEDRRKHLSKGLKSQLILLKLELINVDVNLSIGDFLFLLVEIRVTWVSIGDFVLLAFDGAILSGHFT
jgi:hypothetical protein